MIKKTQEKEGRTAKYVLPADPEQIPGWLGRNVPYGKMAADAKVPRLKIQHQKRKSAYRLQVIVAGSSTWAPGLGHFGDLPHETIQELAATIIKAEGEGFASKYVIPTLEGAKLLPPESVEEVFNKAFAWRFDKGTYKARTRDNYLGALRVIGKDFMRMPLSNVTWRYVTTYCAKVWFEEKKLSLSYWKDFASALHLCFTFANSEGGMKDCEDNVGARLFGTTENGKAFNPTKLYKIKKPRRRKVFRSMRERAAFMRWVLDPKTRLGSHERRYLLFTALTGERPDSLTQLRHEWVNKEQRWAVIPAEARKNRSNAEEETFVDLGIYLTDYHIELISEPVEYVDKKTGGTKLSPWVFPKEHDPSQSMDRNRISEILQGAFRAREHYAEGKTREEVGLPKNTTGYYLMTRFKECYPPAEIQRLIPYEIGRHSVSTLAQCEVGIPGIYATMMLGHSFKKKVDPEEISKSHGRFARIAEIADAFTRKQRELALGTSSASSTTRDFYSHLHPAHIEGLKVATCLWTKETLKALGKDIPASLEAVLNHAMGDEERLLNHIIAKHGSVSEALAAVTNQSLP